MVIRVKTKVHEYFSLDNEPSKKQNDMEENIPLVPYIDLGNFPNDLHLQFSQTQDEQMDAAFDADHPAPGKLATAISGHKDAVGARGGAPPHRLRRQEGPGRRRPLRSPRRRARQARRRGGLRKEV